jgi:hypothetical protein
MRWKQATLIVRDDPGEFPVTDDEVGPMLRCAAFSPCRNYRYSLSRFWNPKLPSISFVGLNPSTADDQTDDPTVRRCVAFARRWNFGGLILTNLFATRSIPSISLRARACASFFRRSGAA